MNDEHFHFVTGRLAERALRNVVNPLAEQLGFAYTIDVLPITVAALMTPRWIARHIRVPAAATRVILPGYCTDDVSPVEQASPCPVEIGPRDLRRLPQFFGRPWPQLDDQPADIEILAEINHAPRLARDELLAEARALIADGADWIDIGCEPGHCWTAVGDAVRAVRDLGTRVSIDSFDPREVQLAVAAGAELVLSVNSTNRAAAADWGCEVVVIPDQFSSLGGLDESVEQLASAGVPLRIDPILEPIGCGFAASLARYDEVRRRYPDAEMLMGIGNLTELTDVDSAGVNLLLLGICQELGIRSVLTTQVINWARSSVRECAIGRRLVQHAVAEGVPPKNLEDRLVMLRDVATPAFGDAYFQALAEQLKDANYRLFAEDGQVHLVSAGQHLKHADPFRLFADLLATEPRNIDVSHAFYLGFEMARAETALQLDKEYRQDEPLDWGYLTGEPIHHRVKLTGSRAPRGDDSA